MPQNRISEPQLTINNQVIQIKPNSLTVVKGYGESTVETQSSGNGVVDVVRSVNGETRIGKVKFMLLTTAENEKLLDQWKANGNMNVVAITESDSGLRRVMKNAEFISDPELGFSSDGEFECEFHGSRVQ